MATVADIISLPSIYSARLVAPCEKAESRTVINVGILDIGPEFNGYSAYMPGEFILTNLGFTNGDELESDRALLAMIDRGVAGIGVKTVYRPHIGEAVKKKSSESGVPVYLYEGRYHEAVVFDALKLIHEDQQEKAREDKRRSERTTACMPRITAARRLFSSKNYVGRYTQSHYNGSDYSGKA